MALLGEERKIILIKLTENTAKESWTHRWTKEVTEMVRNSTKVAYGTRLNEQIIINWCQSLEKKDHDEECIVRVNNWSLEMVGSYIMVEAIRTALHIEHRL